MAVIDSAPFIGTPQDDLIRGSSGNDSLFGGRGNDTLEGSSGNATLDGGLGNDLLTAGSGGNVLIGDRGLDTLVGGNGSDTFVIARAPGGSGSTEGETIVNFNITQDKIGLGGGLTFDQLDIHAIGNDLHIFDKLTGQPLVVVQNVSRLEPNSFTSVPIGDFGGANIDLNGLPSGVRVVGFFNMDKEPSYYLSSSLYTDYANQRDTNQRFVSFDFLQPSSPNQGTRVGPIPHTHTNEFECFFAVDGDFIFTAGEKDGRLMEEVVPAGTLAYGPQGRVHGFRLIPGTGPGRIYSFALPAGLDSFFVNAGSPVTNRYDPIPPITEEEITRTAFWAQQRNDALFFPDPNNPTQSIDGRPVPVFRPDWPDHHNASIYDPNLPITTGPFGETRHILLTPEDVGAVTGQFAWKGVGTQKFVQSLDNRLVPSFSPDPFLDPNVPVYPGGTISYDFISLEPGHDFAPLYTDTRDGYNLFYTLDGNMSILFGNGKEIDVPALTYVQIPNGTAYSIANHGSLTADALSIDAFNAPLPNNDNPTADPGLSLFTLNFPPGPTTPQFV